MPPASGVHTSLHFPPTSHPLAKCMRVSSLPSSVNTFPDPPSLRFCPSSVSAAAAATMEAVDPHVEAAVLWLAQTILEVLFAGKMEAWIRQVGLADDTESLKSEIERVEAVVTAVKGRAAENRPLARSLGRLKELLYDADDMVDELDYYRLQHEVEGGTIAWDNQPQGMDVNGEAQVVDGSRDNSGIPNRKKRSKAWKEFSITEEDADGKPTKAECIYCHTVVRCETTKGTSVLHNHLKSDNCKRKRAAIEQTPNPSSAGNGAQNGAAVSTDDSDRRKRMTSDEVLARNTAANTHLWDKAEICNRIQQMTHQLQKAISDVQKIYGSGFVACSNPCQNTVAADSCRRTSSLVQRKIYGRVEEKNSIIKHMTGDKPDRVIVLPIVGIGGIGKTALAQLLYNDPIVKSQFEHRMWIWVSSNFDEVRLTVEMLDFVSQEKCASITNLSRLQEILVAYVTPKRTLLILDDVWDDIDDCRWNKLLAPLMSDAAKGNVIIMTTRKLSIAKRICTVEPVKLGHLQNDDFWLLFKTCAFGDDNYKEHPSLAIIGQQIVKNLQGNPLAAQTAGMLLRENLTTDHWSNILNNEKWKSLQLNGGIMHALKLSYDELPFYLQQCFLYCSIYPNDHQFLSSELVYIWIAQGFVKCCRSTERLEEVGQRYLTDLLNFGFFEQIETKDPTLGDKILYVVPPLMHDFARLVSGTECAAIDNLTCREILPSIRHLSVLTYSAYQEDKSGNILRNEKFEGKLQRVVNSTRKLRTLVLIGKYDYYFLQYLQGIFQKAQNLRALKISEAYADFGYSACNLVNSTHVRYLKLRTKEDNDSLPEALSNFYHLQVLDIGLHRYSTVPNGMNNLISLRHLVASKAVHSSISSIGKMTSLQELCYFKVDNCTSFEIAQLQSMSELSQLSVSQLEKVVTTEEAYGANVREKRYLEKLHLSWECTSQDEYGNNMSSEPSYEAVETGASKVVLEGLEPHHGLKHLQISGYRSGISPDWLVSTVSVTCLQTLHLEHCRELQVLPSLERLPLLTKLKLNNMWKVRQVTVPSLEELVLIKMPQLERCSCNSLRDLNSSIRVLIIEECRVLKAFPLFERSTELVIEEKSWLSGINELTIHDCPCLIVAHTLPPPSSVCRLSIARVLSLPMIKGSTDRALTINSFIPDMAFHNLRDLTSLILVNCLDISPISLERFRQLISLNSLEIYSCDGICSSDVLLEHAHEDMAVINFSALPSLKRLSIDSCGITGKWLSVMLRHAPALEELFLSRCDQISGLLIEGGQSSSSDHTSTPRASSAGNPDGTLISSTPEKLLCIPSDSVSSLKRMFIVWCKELTFQGGNEGFSGFASLEELTIWCCPKLIPTLVQKYESNDQRDGRWLLPCSLGKLEIDGSLETLRPCFLEDYSCLKKIEISDSSSLRLLQLRSCTALEELVVGNCVSLTAVEGDFTCLRKLKLCGNSVLDSLQLRYCTALEVLKIKNCKSLTALEGDFMCLRKLKLCGNSVLELLLLRSCTALEVLTIEDCDFLTVLEGDFTFLKELMLWDNSGLESLQLRSCTALEELSIEGCDSLTVLEGDFTFLKELVLMNNSGLESLQLRSCTALESLAIGHCASLATLEGNFTWLRKLNLFDNPRLKSLQLRVCTSLEDLRIQVCRSLDTLEDFRSLTGLRNLEVFDCPGLTPYLEHLSQGKELGVCARLERLHTDYYSFLTTSFCQCLTSLRRLELRECPGLVTGLTDEQERALQLLTSLQELRFEYCSNLAGLPVGLHCLPSLKRLEISFCPSILRLPEKGLPPSLEELEIGFCSTQLINECRTLATTRSKLRVQVSEYVT